MEDLNNLSLQDLRIVGRDLGVRAPTALTKNELINEININVSVRELIACR